MRPKFFSTPSDWRAWLEAHHLAADELLVGFYKKESGKPSVTWPESVDQALCFGWIDGIRRSLDQESYSIRFTPRRATSIWSAVNIRRFAELMEQKLVRPAGETAFLARKEDKSRIYAFEQNTVEFTAEQQARFRQHPAAWEYFEGRPAGYRKTTTWWVISAKQESTRARRLEALIQHSELRQPVPQLRPDSKKPR